MTFGTTLVQPHLLSYGEVEGYSNTHFNLGSSGQFLVPASLRHGKNQNRGYPLRRMLSGPELWSERLDGEKRFLAGDRSTIIW